MANPNILTLFTANCAKKAYGTDYTRKTSTQLK